MSNMCWEDKGITSHKKNVVSSKSERKDFKYKHGLELQKIFNYMLIFCGIKLNLKAMKE